jgi:hypothetical protein
MSFKDKSVTDILGYSCLIIVYFILIGFLGSLFIYIYKNLFLGRSLFWEVPLLLIFIGFAVIVINFVLSKISPKINYYVSLAVVLIPLILFVGSIYLHDFFPSDIPYEVYSNQTNLKIECSYSQSYTKFIEKLPLNCIIKVPKEVEHVPSNYILLAYQEKGWAKEKRLDLRQIDYKQKYSFVIKDLDSNHTSFDLIIPIKFNETATYFDSAKIDTYNRIYSKDAYDKKELEKLSYFVALISLAIFSVLSGISNFKQIAENPQNKNDEISKLKKEVQLLKEEIKKTTKKGSKK